jgi:hypothetical protein
MKTAIKSKSAKDKTSTITDIEEEFRCYPCYQTLNGRPAELHERNETCMRLASFYCHCNLPKEEALDRLLKWNDNNINPLDENEVNDVLDSAFNKQYFYCCNDRILKRYCQRGICPAIREFYEDEDTETAHKSFHRLSDGTLAEMLYDPARKPSTFFAVYQDGKIECKDDLLDDWKVIRPFPETQLLQSKTVLLPRTPAEYENEASLIREVQGFIHDYLTVPPLYEAIATYYVLFSWLYDRFTVLPYLRALGDYNSGKSRFLQVIGAAAYKPIFAAGAATPSPIFRLLEMFAGTLILDEADLRFSDESSELIKILNCGYQEGFPVLRTSQESFDVQAFRVFGAKIIATRREFQDKATESRCITCEMGMPPEKHIPLVLTDEFWQRAEQLRNKLLVFRLRKYNTTSYNPALIVPGMETRLNQVITPLLSIIDDENARKDISNFMLDFNKKIVTDRSMTLEYQILEFLELRKDDPEISVSEIADAVNNSGWDVEITPKKVGNIVRKKLQLATVKKRAGYIIIYDEVKMAQLRVKYGLKEATSDDENVAHLPLDTTHIPASGCISPW